MARRAAAAAMKAPKPERERKNKRTKSINTHVVVRISEWQRVLNEANSREISKAGNCTYLHYNNSQLLFLVKYRIYYAVWMTK